jgi:hypothetical protein
MQANDDWGNFADSLEFSGRAVDYGGGLLAGSRRLFSS